MADVPRSARTRNEITIAALTARNEIPTVSPRTTSTRGERLLEAVGDVRFRPDAETVKLALADCRDRLYFDELVGIAQDRNA